jgi:CRP-like cAMP-binding protein
MTTLTISQQPDVLAGLLPEDAAQILALGRSIRLARGDLLFTLGSPADDLYIVDRGRIMLTLPMQVRGHEESVLVEERSPGQAVGWSALIPPHRFTLAAVAPLETHVIALERGALLQHFARHPAVGYAVLRNVAAIVGQRLQVVQAMWLREMQRVVSSQCL